MKNKSQSSIIIAVSATVMLLGGLLFTVLAGLAPTPVRAQTGSVDSALSARTITVVGQGKVNVRPNMAQATIGVEVVKPTVDEASSEAQAVMEAVLKVLREQVDAEKDVQTSGFSIWVERPYGPDNLPGEKAFYHVSNQVSVTIRDLDRVGEVLDSAIEVGANSIYGVNFSVADADELEAEARQIATANAQAKAEELAALNKVKLGDVVSISEVIGSGTSFFAGGFQYPAAYGMGGGAGPVAPGELQMTLQLQVVYEIQ